MCPKLKVIENEIRVEVYGHVASFILKMQHFEFLHFHGV